MSSHWRLAVRYAGWVFAVAAVVAAVVWSLSGKAHAGAFLYGVGVGTVSFVSTALTVSLLMGRSTAGGMMVGALSFGARYGFVATTLGVPAYLGLWPVVAMLGGFVGVYVAENVLLLPGVLTRAIGAPGVERAGGGSVRERVERRVEV
jgi:hypothetical protein